jgi:hypothetical protein
MTSIPSKLTHGEAGTMLAPVVGLERDAIRAYLVIAVADCPGHSGSGPHQAVRMASSATNDEGVATLLAMATSTLLSEQFERD